MIIKLILLLAWLIISILEGSRDAFYFHNKMTSNNPDKKNIHWIFSFERGIVLFLIGWIYSSLYCFLDTGVFIFSLMLLFSFFHNGQYYLIRNKLDNKIYPKKWLDTSIGSESLMEFNMFTRTFLALVGLVGIITSLTF